MKRKDGRGLDVLRQVTIETDIQSYAEGSVLIEVGDTRVLCAVSVQDQVPEFLVGTGKGWITAEYAMLPRSTFTRQPRESIPRGRTQEIQRFIGRSLRAIADKKRFGERTMVVDCDVLQADGGTRTAAITGAYVALYQAFIRLKQKGSITENPLKRSVAAVSAGIVNREILLDLNHDEDSRAAVDFNIVMTDQEEFVEVQGAAERDTFSKDELDRIMLTAAHGIRNLFRIQQAVIDKMAFG